MNMSTEYPTCSQPGTERSNPQGEARDGKPASRNASELDSASLLKVEVANLPDMPKPATVGEAILQCSQQTSRGDWRQRVGKEKSRNLRDPNRAATPAWESEGLIVAEKRLIPVEQRRPTVNVQPLKLYATA